MKVLVFTAILLLFGLPVYSETSTAKENEKSEKSVQSVQEDQNNTLGLIYSVKKLEEATKLVNEGKNNDAEKLLLEISEWLTTVTEYHFNLFQVFNKSSNSSAFTSQGKLEKAHALDFGNLRDQSYFLLAKVYINQNKLKDAMKLLVDIVKSQPETELGKEAYKTLQTIKFSDQAN